MNNSGITAGRATDQTPSPQDGADFDQGSVLSTFGGLLLLALGAVVAQVLLVLAASEGGWLPFVGWGSLGVVIGFGAAVVRWLRISDPQCLRGIAAAWRAPGPWLLVLAYLVQLVIYPPGMHDSLAYRLPRLFLALQHGSIACFDTPDTRIASMTWGWESLALPFAAMNLAGWSRLLNIVSWAFCYQMFFLYVRQRAGTDASARLLALGLGTAPFFVLQAASTASDLLALLLLFTGVFMIQWFTSCPGRWPVAGAVMAFVLAANVKPQFLVLGAPLGLWLLLDNRRPWRQLPLPALAVLVVVAAAVSPVPAFVRNHAATGSIFGSENLAGVEHKPNPQVMALAGSVQFAIAQIQLPVHPAADKLSSMILRVPGFAALHEEIPKFAPTVSTIALIDNASLGFVHMVLVLAGVFACWRIRARMAGWWIAAAVFGFVVAASQIVPTTIGRSFMGFFALLLPVVLYGLACIADRSWLRWLCRLAIASGVATLLLNPAAPLWPARTLSGKLGDSGPLALRHALGNYLDYQKRAQTGAGLLDQVPAGERVGLLVRAVTPLHALWQPDWRAHRIEFVQDMRPVEFAAGGGRWLVVAGNAVEQFPVAYTAFTSDPAWKPVKSAVYLPTLRQGEETWTLYQLAGPEGTP